jgi:hypothetical protein
MNPMTASKEPLSTAMMCLWNDIDAVIEPEYEAWYQRDHLRDRVGTPGFRSCRRYVRVAGEGRQYLTFSDLDSIEATRSAYYLDRLANATEWTRRIMPHFRRMVRVVADVTIDRGDGSGGFIASVAYEHAEPQGKEAARRAIAAALDEVMSDACVTRVRVLERNAASTDVPNPEAALRPDPRRSAELSILLEGSYEAVVTRQLARLLALPALAALQPVVAPSVYRLLFSSRS